MKHSKKTRAALKRRVAGYMDSPSSMRFPHVNDSPNRNQLMHKPGSQNRKKGCSAKTGKKR